MLQILLALFLSTLSFPVLSSAQTDNEYYATGEYYDNEYYTEDTYTESEYYDEDTYTAEEYYNDADYTTEEEYYNGEYTEDTYDYETAPTKVLEVLPTTPHKTTATNKTIYMPPYKTLDFRNLKTKKTPKLLSSDGMLKNLDKSYWLLKFYGHPDIAIYKYIELSIEDSQMNIQLLDYTDSVVENNTHQLTPIKMFKPNEGIFAYPDKNGNLYFMYLNLFLPHLLAMKMTSSFEEAELMSKKSLTELGVFVLR